MVSGLIREVIYLNIYTSTKTRTGRFGARIDKQHAGIVGLPDNVLGIRGFPCMTDNRHPIAQGGLAVVHRQKLRLPQKDETKSYGHEAPIA